MIIQCHFTRFGITGKPTRDSVSLCRNVGLISKVPKPQPAKTLTIAGVDNPLSFDALLSKNPREYPYKPYTAKN